MLCAYEDGLYVFRTKVFGRGEIVEELWESDICWASAKTREKSQLSAVVAEAAWDVHGLLLACLELLAWRCGGLRRGPGGPLRRRQRCPLPIMPDGRQDRQGVVGPTPCHASAGRHCPELGFAVSLPFAQRAVREHRPDGFVLISHARII